MLPSNRRKTVRKCVLDVEVPDGLKYRIRKEIMKERGKLKDIIEEHVEKQKKFESGMGIDYGNLNDEELCSRIRYLEHKKNSLIRILSEKNMIYSQILMKVDESRKAKVRADVLDEFEANKRQETEDLKRNSTVFHRRIDNLICSINENRMISTSNTNKNTNCVDDADNASNNRVKNTDDNHPDNNSNNAGSVPISI
ncbi:hypothetical protein FG386_001995 [Cryptosporidium ryanae]|uniref:uncharacterized protein n=1 Tax=Cryptosporidium ryanae TaxID=515981 RepID=UPI00351A9AE4|nr:hypothetical protein FG386_001995 [Cryptosporidium ryanae]